MDRVECSVCWTDNYTQEYHCKNAHFICNRCLPHIKHCGVCRESLDTFVSDDGKVPIIYTWRGNGCTKTKVIPRDDTLRVRYSWVSLTCSDVEDARMLLRPPFAPAVDGFRGRNHVTSVSDPPPRMDWAESRERWLRSQSKEAMYIRNPNMMSRHPALEPRKRAILVDWLSEVSQMYRLHRETYYVAMDCVDRFLAAEKDIRTEKLQLVGITALFLAAKVEETCPPKLAEFAYVTDRACSENDILVMEIRMLEALNWDLTPITPNAWVFLFLQMVNADRGHMNDEFHMPEFSAHCFVQIMRLLDLCTLDMGSLNYPYSVLTTSAIYHMAAKPDDVLTNSGFEYADIAGCVHWMSPFIHTVSELGPVDVHTFPNIMQYDHHNIQTNVIDMLSLLESAQLCQIWLS